MEGDNTVITTEVGGSGKTTRKFTLEGMIKVRVNPNRSIHDVYICPIKISLPFCITKLI